MKARGVVAVTAALAVAGLGAMALALWRDDIPAGTLRARYGEPSSRYLPLPDGTLLHYLDLGRRDGPKIR